MPPKLQPDCLLAKSYEPGQWKGSYSLVGHTADVMNAVTAMVDILGSRLIDQFGLSCTLEHLRATARLAAYLHDWGKANHHFQGMVRAKIPNTSPRRFYPNEKQMYRHEVISVLLAWEFREWLQQVEGDFLASLIAVGGHHLKLGGEKGKATDELGKETASGDAEIHLYFLHDHFKGLFKLGIRQFGLPRNIVKKLPGQVWTCSELKEKRKTLKKKLQNYQCDQVFIAALKALVIAGDCSASAFPQVDLKDEENKSLNYQEWINRELARTLDKVKLNRVIAARLGDCSLRPFQKKLGEVKTRVAIARAGCGTGKTLGAYNWAKTHGIGRKLFFCYPTTGTSTEGFIDYVHGKLEAELFHSRYQVDLEMMKTGEEDALEDYGAEASIKLESFRAWGAESIVCTVDTVLGLFQCNRRPLYCFPAIANGAFVFDEVHCYDSKLFGTLLRFLEVVKSPVLLMSASVLPWQKKAIEEAVGEPIDIIEGEKELEATSRYQFNVLDKPDWNRVAQELESGGKVLWVCNQVNTAIDVYEEAKQRGLSALLYHSRYRYQDRVEHHRAVVDAFKPEQKKSILAVCTQVAEMSLDLSATLLVSQIADPAGLIQRLGRLNRKYCGHTLDAIFYPDTKTGYPYKTNLLDDGLNMIENFTGEVSQADLAQWLETSTPEPNDCEVIDVVWLDGHWRTYPKPLRKAGHNVTALLEQDLPMIKTLSAKEIPTFTVPIPAKDRKSEEKYKFYPVAPSEIWFYSKELGAKKQGGDKK